jgi:prepilin-type N-terminal cleavage/methylation domain-containing protein
MKSESSDFGFGTSNLEFAMTRQPRRLLRSAFTLMEMLVVVAIIALLVSLTLAAVTSITRAQEEKATGRTISRLNDGITAQVRAVIQDANELPIPQSVINLAGGNMQRAKVIWIKLKLKQNFPMTFREALWPWAIDGNPPASFPPPAGGYPAPIPMPIPSPAFGTGLPSPIPPGDLPPLPAFVDAISKVVSGTGQIMGAGPPATRAGYYSPNESAHLLYIAMTISRRGTRFDPEGQVGPSAIYQDPVGQGGLSGFKDAWDRPLCFFRWPTDFPDNLLNSTDLQDPERTLTPTNMTDPWYTSGLSAQFEKLCHSIHDPNTGQIRPLYAPFALVSSGLNKKLGYTRAYNGTNPLIPEVLMPAYPAITPNFGMALDPPPPLPSPDSNDNIISYSIK